MLIKDLIEYGLSEKEAAIYLALLELETANVNELAKSTGINRSSSYVVLDSLKKKGLVSTSDDKKVRKYIASSPDLLLLTMEESIQKQEAVRNKIRTSIPELKAIYKGTKHRPVVKVFEGEMGLIASFEDTLTSKEKVVRTYSSATNIFKHLPDYLPLYIQKRFEKQIRMRGIHPDSDLHARILQGEPKNFDSHMAIPKSKFSFPADFAIYDNKVGIMSLGGNPISVIIESKEIAETMKAIFDLAWEEAKRLSKNK
jgi:sugar-specific transcriptional regulator TrmB